MKGIPLILGIYLAVNFAVGDKMRLILLQ